MDTWSSQGQGDRSSCCCVFTNPEQPKHTKENERNESKRAESPVKGTEAARNAAHAQLKATQSKFDCMRKEAEEAIARAKAMRSKAKALTRASQSRRASRTSAASNQGPSPSSSFADSTISSKSTHNTPSPTPLGQVKSRRRQKHNWSAIEVEHGRELLQQYGEDYPLIAEKLNENTPFCF
eukprot:m.90638 g.90638  ORF g.90638 m.90638 type:complete len:181 (+) comp12919_c0_seq3:978-1520(+)